MTDGQRQVAQEHRAPAKRRWPAITANVLLVIAIIALLAATWMPAIYDRFAATRPVP